MFADRRIATISPEIGELVTKYLNDNKVRKS